VISSVRVPQIVVLENVVGALMPARRTRLHGCEAAKAA